MNNIEKLLMAFIEAQGFHVKVTVDYDEQESNERNYNMHESGLVRGFRKHFIHKDDSGCLKYMSILLEPRVDYELTKKECNYANAANPCFTIKERVGFIDREIKALTLKKELLLNEKDS